VQTVESYSTDLMDNISFIITDLCGDAIISIYLYFDNAFCIRMVASITKLKNLLTLAAYNQVHVIKEYDIIS
jgi:hypothetical protein